MESLLNPFGIWDSIFNSLGTALYTNIYFRFFVIGLLVGLFFLLIYMLKYKHRDNIKKVLIIIVPLFAICLFVVGKLYSRGHQIALIKEDGLKVINCLQEFHKTNGYYPSDLSVFVPDCVSNEDVKNSKIFRYGLDKDGFYSLSIKPAYVKGEYLVYIYSTNRFEFRD